MARGLLESLITPTRTERFLEGDSLLPPSDVTVHIGASKPGFKRLNASLVAVTIGLITS
ncbi:hypothetical protein DSECCO2_609620 [anaerobic digester metagenome]